MTTPPSPYGSASMPPVQGPAEDIFALRSMLALRESKIERIERNVEQERADHQASIAELKAEHRIEITRLTAANERLEAELREYRSRDAPSTGVLSQQWLQQQRDFHPQALESSRLRTLLSNESVQFSSTSGSLADTIGHSRRDNIDEPIDQGAERSRQTSVATRFEPKLPTLEVETKTPPRSSLEVEPQKTISRPSAAERRPSPTSRALNVTARPAPSDRPPRPTTPKPASPLVSPNQVDTGSKDVSLVKKTPSLLTAARREVHDTDKREVQARLASQQPQAPSSGAGNEGRKSYQEALTTVLPSKTVTMVTHDPVFFPPLPLPSGVLPRPSASRVIPAPLPPGVPPRPSASIFPPLPSPSSDRRRGLGSIFRGRGQRGGRSTTPPTTNLHAPQAQPSGIQRRGLPSGRGRTPPTANDEERSSGNTTNSKESQITGSRPSAVQADKVVSASKAISSDDKQAIVERPDSDMTTKDQLLENVVDTPPVPIVNLPGKLQANVSSTTDTKIVAASSGTNTALQNKTANLTKDTEANLPVPVDKGKGKATSDDTHVHHESDQTPGPAVGNRQVEGFTLVRNDMADNSSSGRGEYAGPMATKELVPRQPDTLRTSANRRDRSSKDQSHQDLKQDPEPEQTSVTKEPTGEVYIPPHKALSLPELESRARQRPRRGGHLPERMQRRLQEEASQRGPSPPPC